MFHLLKHINILPGTQTPLTPSALGKLRQNKWKLNTEKAGVPLLFRGNFLDNLGSHACKGTEAQHLFPSRYQDFGFQFAITSMQIF